MFDSEFSALFVSFTPFYFEFSFMANASKYQQLRFRDVYMTTPNSVSYSDNNCKIVG